ncbi:uncharacterized protein MONBRDRAFT_32291 [Monosiga brevicollis MX1]|uniref:Glucose-6-phosphate 1-dehydrogenase n=1 Tax=Monosiga brevicollis TaxID=81824 RepID=A9UYL2_MONBE|nr:uncharacterized protein MONBRDRAFT_32291 [Monosiga brevicollis MX1]EDQ89624.1 predicted protein [Monosiga brevicollis MX1]|eukprot:XP_001745653.1 hypothetical protein [Monosiga brevicollis MX1]
MSSQKVAVLHPAVSFSLTQTLVSQLNLCRNPFTKLQEQLIITVLGASGDLAKKLVYPALWDAYRFDSLPEDTRILGYARSKLSHEDLVERFKPQLKVNGDDDEKKRDSFLESLDYIHGQYDEAKSFKKLNEHIESMSQAKTVNRMFYIALPPSVYKDVTEQLSNHCQAKSGFTRVVVEKPFGKDLESYQDLNAHMSNLFAEDQIYRIDHYLGKEMVQNLLALRFANRVFEPSWNRHHVACVMLTMKEDFGTQGRGGYFDEFGIIRDVMQNHLLQMLTLCAMEKPVSTGPDDIRDEKTKVLRCIKPLKIEDTVLGQFVGNPEGESEESRKGYTDEEDVPNDSNTPTFATAVFHIENDRWEGVPFIIRCGKALNEKKAELRVQFRSVPADIFGNSTRNELVLRVQPDEAIYLKVLVKEPGASSEVAQTDLDLSYKCRFGEQRIPSAYERLIVSAIKGNSANFVRSDELEQAWRIFTPILHDIDAGKVKPKTYKFGSRGPSEADDLVKKHNFSYAAYEWSQCHDQCK